MTIENLRWRSRKWDQARGGCTPGSEQQEVSLIPCGETKWEERYISGREIRHSSIVNSTSNEFLSG